MFDIVYTYEYLDKQKRDRDRCIYIYVHVELAREYQVHLGCEIIDLFVLWASVWQHIHVLGTSRIRKNMVRKVGEFALL